MRATLVVAARVAPRLLALRAMPIEYVDAATARASSGVRMVAFIYQRHLQWPIML